MWDGVGNLLTVPWREGKSAEWVDALVRRFFYQLILTSPQEREELAHLLSPSESARWLERSPAEEEPQP